MSSQLQDRLRLLRQRPFALFMWHIFLTVAGGGLSYILVTWHVFELTHSLHSLVVNALCFWVPGIVLGPFVGLIVDRNSRKNVLIATNLLRAIAFASIGVISSTHVGPLYCYALTAINGVAFAFGMPAFSAFIREVVADKDLLIANTTIDMSFELANIIGMGLAGLAVVTLTFSQGLLACAAFTAAGSLLLFFIRQHDLLTYVKETSMGFIKDWSLAFNTLKQRPVLTLLLILQVLLFVQLMFAPLLITPFVKNVLHQGSTVFSELEIAVSIGLISGAFLITALVKRWGFTRTVTTGLTLMGASLLVFSHTHSVSLAIILYGLLGISLATWSAIISRAQTLTPKSQQGRVQSLVNTMSSLCILMLYLYLQSPANHASLTQEYLLAALFSIFALVIVALIFRKENTACLKKADE